MDSKVKYGQEIGPILIKVCKKLLQNENLIMLLNNTDLDPLNKEKHPEKIDGMQFLHKLVKPVPLIDAEDQTTKSKVVVMFTDSSIEDNKDNEFLSLGIFVYCPFKEWLIAGDNLRPYAIMSEIRKSLQDKRINGLGEVIYGGFHVTNLTEEMASFDMRFYVNGFI